MFWRPPQNRMLARNALVLLLATLQLPRTILKAPTASCRVATLGRGSTALGSNVFLAGECMGIVGTILYFSRDFSFSSAVCPPANVTYNQAIQIVTSVLGRSGFRNGLSTSRRKLCTMRGHVSQT